MHIQYHYHLFDSVDYTYDDNDFYYNYNGDSCTNTQAHYCRSDSCDHNNYLHSDDYDDNDGRNYSKSQLPGRNWTMWSYDFLRFWTVLLSMGGENLLSIQI